MFSEHLNGLHGPCEHVLKDICPTYEQSNRVFDNDPSARPQTGISLTILREDFQGAHRKLSGSTQDALRELSGKSCQETLRKLSGSCQEALKAILQEAPLQEAL